MSLTVKSFRSLPLSCIYKCQCHGGKILQFCSFCLKVVVYLYFTFAKCSGIAAFSLWPGAHSSHKNGECKTIGERKEDENVSFIILNRNYIQLPTIGAGLVKRGPTELEVELEISMDLCREKPLEYDAKKLKISNIDEVIGHFSMPIQRKKMITFDSVTCISNNNS